MKKTLSIVLLVLLVFLAVACSPEVKQHTHEFKELKKVAPTCTERGYTILQCECGAQQTTDYKDALGHKWGETPDSTTAKSCKEIGTSVYKCKNDGCKEEKVVNGVLGNHAWVVDKEKSYDATCVKNGKTVSTCSVCGETKEEVAQAKGHTWDDGEDMEERNCVSNIHCMYTCKDCGVVSIKEKEGTKLPHTYPVIGGSIIAVGGQTVYGKIFDYDTEKTDMTGEGFDVKWDNKGKKYTYKLASDGDATCTEEAVYEGVCLVCGTEASKTTINGFRKDTTKAGHKHTTEKTDKEKTILSLAEKSVYCDDCGATLESGLDEKGGYASVLGVWAEVDENGRRLDDMFLVFSGEGVDIMGDGGITIYTKNGSETTPDVTGKRLAYYDREDNLTYVWNSNENYERYMIGIVDGGVGKSEEVELTGRGYLKIGDAYFERISTEYERSEEKTLTYFDSTNHYMNDVYGDVEIMTAGVKHNTGKDGKCDVDGYLSDDFYKVTIVSVDGDSKINTEHVCYIPKSDPEFKVGDSLLEEISKLYVEGGSFKVAENGWVISNGSVVLAEDVVYKFDQNVTINMLLDPTVE